MFNANEIPGVKINGDFIIDGSGDIVIGGGTGDEQGDQYYASGDEVGGIVGDDSIDLNAPIEGNYDNLVCATMDDVGAVYTDDINLETPVEGNYENMNFATNEEIERMCTKVVFD